MEILEVENTNKHFAYLCKTLEDYQYKLLPGIKEKGYSLTNDLHEVVVAFVMYENEKPIGSIGLKKVSDTSCEIVRVLVLEDFRGKGYSKLLFEKVHEKAKEMGFKKAEIVAWKKAEAAVCLYKKLGYNVCHEGKSEWFGGYDYVEFEKEFWLLNCGGWKWKH